MRPPRSEEVRLLSSSSRHSNGDGEGGLASAESNAASGSPEKSTILRAGTRLLLPLQSTADPTCHVCFLSLDMSWEGWWCVLRFLGMIHRASLAIHAHVTIIIKWQLMRVLRYGKDGTRREENVWKS